MGGKDFNLALSLWGGNFSTFYTIKLDKNEQLVLYQTSVGVISVDSLNSNVENLMHCMKPTRMIGVQQDSSLVHTLYVSNSKYQMSEKFELEFMRATKKT